MIICICGPTAVGKTKLSIALAHKLDALIINADAMQVYKAMNIGTGKIKEEEKEKIEHLLFDIKNVDENYSVYDYQSDARKILAKYSHKNIIFVGGSGLYLKAALFDYKFSEYQEVQDYSGYSNEQLYDLCLKKDSNMNIHKNNRKRLINFLNNTALSNNKDKLLYKDVYFIGLTTSREILYNKINLRVDKMFEEGLLDEAKSLYDLHVNSKALNTAIGYKELFLYFDNKITLEEAKELIKKNTRHYAKRQYTWFNNQMDLKYFQVDYDNFDNTVKQVCDYLKSLKITHTSGQN